MKIDVWFTPALTPQDLQGRAAVIDVLRATTTIAVALASGAKAVVPAGSTEEALRIAQNLERDDVILAGERKSVRVPGFAAGNSPLEFTPEVVTGKTVILATTNGTPALVAAQAAKEVLAAAAVNFGAVVQRCRVLMEEQTDLVIVCAGSERHFALEDAFAAGRLIKVLLPDGGLRTVQVNDAGVAALELARHYGERWLRAFKASAHGRHLDELGFKEDLKAASLEDTHNVLAVYADRKVTAHRAPATS